ncbi:MAG: ATP-binding protein [Actinobacteria bacterium]|nr:ATP-binding protein [Actinomycetota bacterium]
MKIRYRQVIGAILLTTLISFLIGSFAIWGSYRADLDVLDRSLNRVISEPLMHPQDAINEALASVEINSVDVAVAFITSSNEITILRESTQFSQILLDSRDLIRSLSSPIFLHGNQNIRAIAMELPENEYLLFGISTLDLDKNLKLNELRLLAFILIANFLASLLIIWNSKRQRVRSEKDRLQKMQEFLGDAAHELRTPLTVIKGYSELLAQKKLPTQEDERRAFERLESEISRMDTLISDLLLLAEIGETATITRSVFDLGELLQNHIKDFKVISPAHPVTYECDEIVDFSGSQVHLQRLIQNALLNIDRHTPKDSPVSISLRSKGKEIHLLIEDGGPGLNDSVYGKGIRSLKRFDRSRSRETGGSGLGLSIMNAIVEMHKGNFTLRKSSLGGLAIDIRLPITR